jgi:hypothetical protein
MRVRPAGINPKAALTGQGGRIRSAAFALVLAAMVAGCQEKHAALPAPDSIESLCLGVSPGVARIFKLPGIDAVRSDQLVKARDGHVDVAALERVAASPVRESAEPETDEDGVRLYVTDNAGGVIVWWREKPVIVRYQASDAKPSAAKAEVFGAAIADGSDQEHGRVVYLLERPAGTVQTPAWRPFIVSDAEHVCT